MTGATSILTSGLKPVAEPFPFAMNGSSRAGFAAHLASARNGSDADTLREAVEQLVSSSLVLPSLSVLRESSMGVGAFAPGTAEKRFGPLLDQRIADEVTHGANFPLVDAIVRKLTRTYNLAPSPVTAPETALEPTHA